MAIKRIFCNNPSPMDDHQTLFKMMQVQNMNCISMFYKHAGASLRDALKVIENWDELDDGKRTWWKREFEIHYPAKLRETSFLLMFGHMEEMLTLMTQSFNPRKVGLPEKNGFAKYKPYISDLLGAELSTNQDFKHIVDAQKVRNAILHIAGRVSLSRDSKHLQALARTGTHYEISNDRIGITHEGLGAMQKAILRLFEELLKQSSQEALTSSAPA